MQATAFSNNDQGFALPITSNLVTASISDRDTDPIALRFAPPLDVVITEDWGGQQAPSETRVAPVMLLAESGMQLMGGLGHAKNLSAGRYHIVAVPDRAPGFYPAAVMLAGRDVQGQDVELSSGTAINVVYKPNAGTVRGAVAQDQPATVLLWRLGNVPPDLVPLVPAGTHGAFESTNLPPGGYSVIAFDHVPAEGALGTFASTILARGTRVSIQEGGVESVQIPVLRWGE